MPEIDHYQVLGLEANASPAEIRRAFRSLALRYHPDQNPDRPEAEERFKLVTQAYKVLIDSKKRWEYDRTRKAAQTQRNRVAEENRRRAAQKRNASPSRSAPSRGAAKPTSDQAASGSDRKGKPWWEEEQERLRKEKKASSPRSPKPPPESPPPRPKPKPEPEPESLDGKDLVVDMTITSAVADVGGRQPLALSRFDPCPVCEGTGAKPDTTIRPCPECGPGNPSPKCYLCSGRGNLIQAFCVKCNGNAKIRLTKTIVVTIPPRAKQGQEIRLPGEGMPPREGGKPGDLIVHLAVKEGAEYEQRDDAVYSEVHVTPATAAMGGSVRVKTIDATAELTIPPGTKSGTVLRLAGQGPVLKGKERGDHYVTVKIIET